MKKMLSAIAGLMLSLLPLMATELTVSSPDGNMLVTLSNETGKTTYSVTYKGTPFINASPLGLNTNVGDFTQEMALSDQVKRRTVDETYALPNIKKSQVHYTANEAVFVLTHKDK